MRDYDYPWDINHLSVHCKLCRITWFKNRVTWDGKTVMVCGNGHPYHAKVVNGVLG